MTNKSNQPRVYDAVRGGQAPPPVEGVVLGGIEGVKSRLSSPVIASKVSALREALNYGEAGLNLIISALEDKIRLVQRSASLLLQDREEPQAKLALKQYNFWSSFQRLDGLPVGHTSIFANQEIITFDSNHITNPAGTAYFLGGMIIGSTAPFMAGIAI